MLYVYALPLTISNIAGHLRPGKSVQEKKLDGVIGSSCTCDEANAAGSTS